VLEKPVAQFVGRISYSFYLYNVLVFTVVCGYLKQWPLVASHPVEAGLLASVPVIAITILFAYFSTRFVEVPGIELGRAISSMPTTVRQS
jgi:peptidoglycan/LPS O-acetylase OafA/YrhL